MTAETIKKFRPSNGCQGEAFVAGWCGECQRGIKFMCEIRGRTMAFSLDDPEYPDEWRYDDDGYPCCTAFEPWRE